MVIFCYLNLNLSISDIFPLFPSYLVGLQHDTWLKMKGVALMSILLDIGCGIAILSLDFHLQYARAPDVTSNFL